MEEWLEIEYFPGYSVSNQGRVRNDVNGYVLAQTRNPHGHLFVGLCRDRMQYKRSVTVLVARSFLAIPKSEAFDTPIHLDGDRANNYVGNLLWRPRWFAVEYQQQFYKDARDFDAPIQEVKSGECFDTPWDAVMKYGLLLREIKSSIMNKTYAWPTYQRFRLIDTN